MSFPVRQREFLNSVEKNNSNLNIVQCYEIHNKLDLSIKCYQCSFTYKASPVNFSGVLTEENWRAFEDNCSQCCHIRRLKLQREQIQVKTFVAF